MSIKAFRLFISSTFSDFHRERARLHGKIFPKIDKYCRRKGYQFHPIDLRWGVNSEAQLDQQTVEICLRQVETSKLYPPPNFLIMLGHRHGWVPLPYAIAAEEFEALCQNIEKHYPSGSADVVENLRRLYVLNENHLIKDQHGQMVPAHVLVHRTGRLADAEEWQKIENFYRPHLQGAAERLFAEGRLSARAYERYFISLTEQEIIHGICGFRDEARLRRDYCQDMAEQVNGGRDHALAFLRDLENREQAEDFVEEAPRLEQLRRDVADFLQVHAFHGKTRYDPQTGQLDPAYLDDFASRVEQFLLAQVDAHISHVEELEKAPGHVLQTEQETHRAFLDEKLKIFVGRKSELEQIAAYVAGAEAGHPLIIHGRSGQGKSALIAKAANEAASEARTSGTPILTRFIGTSASSGDLRALLISLMEELASHGLVEPAAEWETDDNKFARQISETLAAISGPVHIFLDALDQLRGGVRLDWLPGSWPAGLKLVISVLEDEDFVSDSEWFRRLKMQYPSQALLAISPLDTKHGGEMLDALLHEAARALSQPQRDYVLAQFAQANGSPLYLKTAFEIFRNWKSSDQPGETVRLADSAAAIINQFIDDLTRLYHHERELVQKVLAYLAAGKNGLSEPELMAVLSHDEAVMDAVANEQHVERPDSLPASVWARLHGQLAPFLAIKTIDDAPLLQFFHRQMAQAAKKLVVPETHAALADYFEGLGERKEGEEGEVTWPKRTLSELPFQLHHAGRKERLDELLLDVSWMRQKLAAFDGPQELVGDYRQYAKEHDVATNIVGRALELITHILERDQKQLLPQLLGRLSADMGEGLGEMLVKMCQLVRPPALIPTILTLRNPKDPILKVFHIGSRVLATDMISSDQVLLATEDSRLQVLNVIGDDRLVLCDEVEIEILKVLPDGFSAISCAGVYNPEDKNLRLWNLSNGEFHPLKGHNGPIIDFLILSDGRIVSSSEDHTLRIWDLRTLESKILGKESDRITALLALPDNFFLTGSEVGNLRLWDLNNGVRNRFLLSQDYPIWGLLALPDGSIISFAEGGLPIILDIRSGRKKTAYLDNVTGPCAVLPDGHLLTSSMTNELLLWDLETCKSDEINIGYMYDLHSVLALENGCVLLGSDDDTLKLITPYHNVDKKVIGHRGSVNAFVKSSNGLVLSGGDDAVVRWWNLSTFETGEIKTEFTSGIVDLIQLSDEFMLVNCLDSLWLWNIEIGDAQTLTDDGPIYAAKVLPNGLVVSVSRGNVLKLWNLDSQKNRNLGEATDTIRCLEVLGNNRIISGSQDGTLMEWDLKSNRMNKVGEHDSCVTALAALSDERIISGALDHTLRIWDLKTKENEIYSNQVGTVHALISLRNRFFISGSWDKMLRLFDIGINQGNDCIELTSFYGDSGFRVLALIDNDEILMAGDHAGQVHIFDIILDESDKARWLKRLTSSEPATTAPNKKTAS